KGKRIEVSSDRYVGTRDRSWGVRPVGAQDSQQVAPPRLPQFYWLWAPMNFDDRITLFHDNADANGKSWNTAAVMAPTGGDGPMHMASCSSNITFKSGTRHARAATLSFADEEGGDYQIELKPQWNFYMSGLGYTHPEWGHGRYRGELAVGYDALETAKVNEGDMPYLHVQA